MEDKGIVQWDNCIQCTAACGVPLMPEEKCFTWNLQVEIVCMLWARLSEVEEFEFV